MLVTLKPVGGEEYPLTLSGLPQFSSALGIGYEAATVPCRLDDTQRLAALGGRLRIHGVTGIVWQGIVTRRPGRTDALEARGWGWCGSLNRRKKLYAKTDFLQDLQAYMGGTNSNRFQLLSSGGAIYITQLPDTTSAIGDLAGYTYLGDEVLTKLMFAGFSSHANARLGVTSLDSAGAIISTDYTYNGPGTVTGQTVTFPANTYGFIVWCQLSAVITPPDASIGVQMYSMTLYGISGTVTSAAVLDDILDNEIAATYLPAGDAYRAWCEADTTAFDALTFESSTAADKIEKLAQHSAYDFGWYTELVAGQPTCVPHWTARETTPSLILRLAECESYDLDECSLDELASVLRVEYHDVNGNAQYVDVTDTTAGHPLVDLGITRYADLTVDTSSSATATTIGTAAIAEMGRRQLKGQATTRIIRTATGVEAYLPSVRAGQMVRVVDMPDGYVDCVVRRITCTADGIASVELDNEPYRLDILLAHLRG